MPDLENSGHNNAMQAFEIVRQSWLFSELTQEEVQKIVSVGKVVSLSPGHVLLEKAKPNDSLYIILDGIFSVRAKTPTEFKKLVELQAGDIFGEMSWLDGHPASSYVVSDTASKVLKIPFEALNEALYQMSGAYIQILKKFAINLSHRLRA